MKSLIPVCFLVVALSVLAAMQYRWIGQLSEAERQRLENGLRDSSGRFAQEFSEEIRRLSDASQIRDSMPAGGAIILLIDRYREWARLAPHRDLLKSLYVADRAPGDALRLRQVDIDRKTAEEISWPEELSDLALYLKAGPGASMRAVSLHGVSALVAPIPGAGVGPGPRVTNEWVIAILDRAVITGEILAPLAARNFPRVGDQDYRLAVLDTDTAQTVYTSTVRWSAEDLAHPDYAVELLPPGPPGPPRPRGQGPERGPDRNFQRGQAGRGGPGQGGADRGFDRGPGPGPRGGPDRGAGRGQSRDPGPPQQAGRGRPPDSPGAGPVIFIGQRWRLLVKHEAGSLEIAVESARRRNLAVSFGVLLVLSAAALIVAISGQRARALGKLQMEFAAGVSHELRTPLAVIQSAAHNLESGIVRDPETVGQYAAIVQKEARRLSSMVEQVMAYAETQSGRKRYDVSPVDVRDIVDQSLKSLSLVDDISVTVEQRMDPDLPPVLADPTALVQCLQNLISNAVKYGRQGNAVQIEIGAEVDKQTGKLRLAVSDRGPGVPSADIRSLFDPFHRGRNAATNTPGNGLGLRLVRVMMESQKGAVSYTPRAGGGATFTLIVPVAGAST